MKTLLICHDGARLDHWYWPGEDLWRFTADGLPRLCERDFTIVGLAPSITVGPALSLTVQCATSRIRSRPVANGLSWLVTLLVYPLR
jgi:hypothetical protein